MTIAPKAEDTPKSAPLVLHQGPRMGELLLREGLITREQLDRALKMQEKDGGKLGRCLIQLGLLSEDAIAGMLARQYGVPSVNLKFIEPTAEALKLIPAEVAQRQQILPLARLGSTVTVAIADPANVLALDEVRARTNLSVEAVVASGTAIAESLARYYSGGEGSEEFDRVMKDLAIEQPDLEVADDQSEFDVGSLEKAAEEAPIVKLVNLILIEAVRRGASDIHLEPYEKELRVRYRIDGVLQEVMTPLVKLREPIASRLKIMAKLDISEKRLPQDGRMVVRYTNSAKRKELDFRVSVVPTLFGEKIVLRLLDKESLRLDMRQLGFDRLALDRFERSILKPYGMVLVTGPTGSGKTNTLYSSVARLNTEGTNIMTAEDPVEFQLQGINQVQIKEQIGLTFAAALRSFLRQDPNIILVGEIRDVETAEIAVKAALTGHLVLSTLHTNDAPSAVSRLINMGIEPFLVATSVNLICAQRLVRRVCPHCKERTQIPPEPLLAAGFSSEEAETLRLWRGRGCKICHESGYKGRVGLFEVLEITEPIREMILRGASALEIRKRGVEEGMTPLRQSGLAKMKEGVTTLEEVLRETVD